MRNKLRKKMANMDIGKENKKKPVKESDGNQKPSSLDQIGSVEFYQGEKIIEDVTLPGEKRVIKTETVKKDEIYEDKMKKQEAFIESLGRKKEAEEKSAPEQPEYIEKKSPPAKKIIFSLLGIVILVAAAGGGYWAWSKKKQPIVSEEASTKIVIPVNPEPEQSVSPEEQNVQEKKQPALTEKAKLTVKVLNEGAAVGSAGKTKTLLVGKGYTKAQAGNGELDSSGTFIYYSGQASVQDAEAVSKILSDSGTKSEVKAALISEQKSADIVVVLGKI